ncbi:MAG: HEAT repeat domain-containing protein [Microcoleus sp. SU_5_3]|nr:HEAT repeat domain-containing protein [Microcoleus sp. SU_5_3]
MIGGWKDDHETLPILKQRARSPDYWTVQKATLQELARGWKDDPETLAILRDRAQNHRDPILRDFAQQKLAEVERQ